MRWKRKIPVVVDFDVIEKWRRDSEALARVRQLLRPTAAGLKFYLSYDASAEDCAKILIEHYTELSKRWMEHKCSDTRSPSQS